MAELGRKPREAAALVNRFADRVLFGTDSFPPDESVYLDHVRFLQSEDECYDHDADSPPLMGRWTISALGLEDGVLRRVYADNARRLLAASLSN